MTVDVEPPPRMDPRIRERRIRVKREAGRRRLRLLLAGAGLGVAAAAAFGTTRSPLFDVDAVHVRGGTMTPDPQVIAAAGLDRPRQLADLNLAAMERGVEALPWVLTATATREWPGTVQIAVTERTGVAVVEAPDVAVFALVDGEGRVLAGAAPETDLPAISGVGHLPAPGETIRAARPALDVLAELPDKVVPRRFAIGDGAIDMTLDSGTLVRVGQAVEIEAKALALATLVERVDLRSVAVIDVRVPSAPALTHR